MGRTGQENSWVEGEAPAPRKGRQRAGVRLLAIPVIRIPVRRPLTLARGCAGTESVSRTGCPARKPSLAHTSTGMGCGAGSPTYSDEGRMSRLLSICSKMCAAQPITRLHAKVGVNMPRGTPHVSITTPA